MNRRKRTVEILMATYNGAAYLEEQISSILAQSDSNWRLVISDDGSNDGTVEIAEEYAAQFPEKIVRYVSGKRFGNARDHFFHLMRTSAAEYLFFCDQDDVWYEDKVKLTLEALMDAEEKYGKETPLLVFSDQTPTDAQLHPLAASLMRYQNQYFGEFDYRSILMQNVVTGGAMCINRALADMAGKCTDPGNTIMHDWWIAVVAARFGQIVYIDKPLGDYRQHGTNSVGAKNVRSMAHIVNKLSHIGAIRKTTEEKRCRRMFLQIRMLLTLMKQIDSSWFRLQKIRVAPRFTGRIVS